MPTAPTPPAPPAAPRTPKRRRALHIALGVIGALVAALVIAIIVIATFDWNRAKPWVNEKVSEATGRRFAIEGNLSADWHWPQPMESGWRRWIPGVTVQAEQIAMDNPEGFTLPEEPAKGSDTLPALPRKLPPESTDKVAAAAPRSAASAAPAAAAAATPASGASAPAVPASAAASAPVQASTTADANADASHALQQAQGDAKADAPPRGAATMGTLGSASATLRLLPLLSRTVVLDTVVLTAPDVVLGRKQDGSNNWTFKERGEPQQNDNPWDMKVGQLIIRGGWLGYADGVKDLSLRARLDTIDTAPGATPDKYGLRFAMQGRYGKARVTGDGQAGSVLTLREKEVNYPVQFKARAGTLATEVEGTLANPASLDGMDLQVMLKGASMADLYDLTGLVLPNTPPFQTRGHLVGSLEPERATWNYRDFHGTVGESDLHGNLTYTSGKPRPKLKGEMTSKQLRFADLGPVVGAPSAPGKNDKGTSVPDGKVLPNVTFATDRWNAMDLDLVFSGQQIVRPEGLPIDNLKVHALLNDAELTLSPLQFGVAQGKIDSQVVLDSRTQPMKAQLRGTVEGLKLSALFPKVELMEKSFGRLDGAVALNASGNSVATLLGTGTGEARIYIRDGTFSKQMLDLAALNVGSIVVTRLFGGNKEVKLRCAVADFAVKNGRAETRTVKLSTEEAVVEAVGTIDLSKEYMDLRIKPESLQWKFLSLRTPLTVRGTFADPKVGLETGPLLLRAGAAVVAAVAAPVALAVIPVTVPAAEDDANCGNLLAQANSTVRGGAAGAAAKPEAGAVGTKGPANAKPPVEAPKRRAANAPDPVPAPASGVSAPVR